MAKEREGCKEINNFLSKSIFSFFVFLFDTKICRPILAINKQVGIYLFIIVSVFNNPFVLFDIHS